MKRISEQELKDILDRHGKWLRNEEGGIRANLSSADLRSANLRSADLSSANLRYANLSYADLSYADLRSANLRSADLRYANLSDANLRSANLSDANLSSVYGFKFTPLQVVNTQHFITIFDDHVIWGCRRFTFDEVKALTLADCTTEWNEDEFNLNKKIVMDLIGYYRAKTLTGEI